VWLTDWAWCPVRKRSHLPPESHPEAGFRSEQALAPGEMPCVRARAPRRTRVPTVEAPVRTRPRGPFSCPAVTTTIA